MSEMTDAELLDLMKCGHPVGCLVVGTSNCKWCEDVARAKLQWRTEPPDTVGLWVRHRNGDVKGLVVHREPVHPSHFNKIHVPGDRWLKLPEVPERFVPETCIPEVAR